VFVAEFGIVREVRGAPEYLGAVAGACLSRHISCLVYAFREATWDAMNYELGPRVGATVVNTRLPWSDNPLVNVLLDMSPSSRVDDS